MVWLETLPDDWWKSYQSISLSTHCIHELNIELLFIVRSLLLETRTYARACKRICLCAIDFQAALETRNIYRNKNFTNYVQQLEKTSISVLSLIDQVDQLSSKTNRLELTIHWLAIDGQQPIISDNPPANFSEDNSEEKKQKKSNGTKILPNELINRSSTLEKLFQIANTSRRKNYVYQEHIHPLTKNNLTMKPTHPRNLPLRRFHANNNKVPCIESIQTCLAHELSIEQQLYFKLLTESCFNGTDKQCADAFHCFSSDAALQPLLPRLLLFIALGIQTNIHLHDLSFILRFLSILKMLTSNKFISFDKYLHSIMPTLLTCLLCIFDLAKNDPILSTIDHNSSNNYSAVWTLREQTSDFISYFEDKYSNISYFTERICSIIKRNLNNTTTTFSIVYAYILQNYKQTKLIEVDFDLDYNEQKTLFNQKINELLGKYNGYIYDIQAQFANINKTFHTIFHHLATNDNTPARLEMKCIVAIITEVNDAISNHDSIGRQPEEYLTFDTHTQNYYDQILLTLP
ncbi:unnamed protein product [Rotaria socialis]|uniref:TAF6 C-terminal HEAT repeat domain-containing protein n=2 Tax=Rotaria socialis TaxID=392032 RepID=A0A820PK70_9BILA|nr:unnamed protein product [Rotaria socialis]